MFYVQLLLLDEAEKLNEVNRNILRKLTLINILFFSRAQFQLVLILMALFCDLIDGDAIRR